MKIFGYDVSFTKTVKPASAARLPLSAPMGTVIGGTAILPSDFYAQVEAFRSWAYVCSSKNAQAVAKGALRVYVRKRSSRGKLLVKTAKLDRQKRASLECRAGLTKFFKLSDDVEEILDHPFLDLMQNVNGFMNRFDCFELTQLFLELTGNSYWYLVKGPLGVPVELWILPPQYMRVIPDPKQFIKGYMYVRNSEKIPYEEDEIVHFKFPSPQSYLYGFSPVSAVAASIGLNADIMLFESTLFKNMGRPEGVLSTEQSLNDEDFERLKKEWRENYGGMTKVGKTIVLEKGLTYTPITMPPKDLVLLAGRRPIVEEICSAFGVPMSKVTTQDVNLANAQIGEVQYQRDTIEPRLIRIEEKLNEKVMPLYDGDIFCAFDSPVPEDKEFRLKERESNLRTGYSSPNLERQKDGEAPVPWGERPILPFGIGPMQDVPLIQEPSQPDTATSAKFVADVVTKINEVVASQRKQVLVKKIASS